MDVFRILVSQFQYQSWNPRGFPNSQLNIPVSVCAWLINGSFLLFSHGRLSSVLLPGFPESTPRLNTTCLLCLPPGTHLSLLFLTVSSACHLFRIVYLFGQKVFFFTFTCLNQTPAKPLSCLHANFRFSLPCGSVFGFVQSLLDFSAHLPFPPWL